MNSARDPPRDVDDGFNVGVGMEVDVVDVDVEVDVDVKGKVDLMLVADAGNDD